LATMFRAGIAFAAFGRFHPNICLLAAGTHKHVEIKQSRNAAKRRE
jgi:hypothetical protein